MTKKKGPGKAYRVGMNDIELHDFFATEEAAEAWFIASRWPDGVRCPKCDSDNVQERPTRKPQPFRCRACRKDFSVRTGSVMHASKLPLRVWALALHALATDIKGTSSLKLHRKLGITQKAAWHLAHRIRETWEDKHHLFDGPVEADETYFGGKEINKHASKKIKAGRGTVGKFAVVGVKDRATNHVCAQVVDSTDAETLQSLVLEHTRDAATVYTDEARAYDSIPRVHETVQHGKGVYVKGPVTTNGMESFWSMMKRGYVGTYHYMSRKHLDRYVKEFVGRHNQREADTIDQMVGMARGLDGKRLTYQQLTA